MAKAMASEKDWIVWDMDSLIYDQLVTEHLGTAQLWFSPRYEKQARRVSQVWAMDSQNDVKIDGNVLTIKVYENDGGLARARTAVYKSEGASPQSVAWVTNVPDDVTDEAIRTLCKELDAEPDTTVKYYSATRNIVTTDKDAFML
ncbi:MAG: hypothetical protein CMK92_00770 [Pseudomonas sp.]|nr:hypothetical protein [Pseudomonas sp.]